MSNSCNYQKHRNLNGLKIIFFISFCLCTLACNKTSQPPDKPILDSISLVTSIRFETGDSASNGTGWHISSYIYDSINNRIEEKMSDSAGAAYRVNNTNTFQYDNNNRLISIVVSQSLDQPTSTYQSIYFTYNSSGDLQKAIITDLYGNTAEEQFATTIYNGRKVITQYDTLNSNLPTNVYYSYRPEIIQYTFDQNENLLTQNILESMGGPFYNDTINYQFEYDANNHLTQLISENNYTDIDGLRNPRYDSFNIRRDNSSVTPVNDLHLALFRNLYWLSVPDEVTPVPEADALSNQYIDREVPLITINRFSNTASGSYVRVTSHQNAFTAEGLLSSAAINYSETYSWGGGYSSGETRLYTYKTVKK
jgi:hypothetical protein